MKCMGEMTGMVNISEVISFRFYSPVFQAKHGKLVDERFLRMIGAMYDESADLAKKTREYDECSNQG
jgi:hypothetical protein